MLGRLLFFQFESGQAGKRTGNSLWFVVTFWFRLMFLKLTGGRCQGMPHTRPLPGLDCALDRRPWGEAGVCGLPFFGGLSWAEWGVRPSKFDSYLYVWRPIDVRTGIIHPISALCQVMLVSGQLIIMTTRAECRITRLRWDFWHETIWFNEDFFPCLSVDFRPNLLWFLLGGGRPLHQRESDAWICTGFTCLQYGGSELRPGVGTWRLLQQPAKMVDESGGPYKDRWRRNSKLWGTGGREGMPRVTCRFEEGRRVEDHSLLLSGWLHYASALHCAAPNGLRKSIQCSLSRLRTIYVSV